MVSVNVLKGLNKCGLLPLLNLSTAIRVNDTKVFIPVREGLGYGYLQLSEPWMISLLRKLRPLFSGHFVDIGVNLGQTLVKAYSVYGKIKYTGFEPNPACIAYLHELIKLNRFQDCTILPVGISDSTGILKLNFFYDNKIDSSASMIEQFRSNQKVNHSIHIPVADLSVIKPFLPDVKQPFLKIDVEGAELEVMRGLFDWIKEMRPIILMEILPVYKKENEFRYRRQLDLEELFQGMGYYFARIKKAGKVHWELIKKIGIHDNLDDCDYIIYHSSLEEKLMNCLLKV